MILPDFLFDLSFMVKIFFLFLIGIYSIFVFVVFTNIRSLNKLMLVESASGSKVISVVTLFYLLVTIFLFVLALVIL